MDTTAFAGSSLCTHTNAEYCPGVRLVALMWAVIGAVAPCVTKPDVGVALSHDTSDLCGFRAGLHAARYSAGPAVGPGGRERVDPLFWAALDIANHDAASIGKAGADVQEAERGGGTGLRRLRERMR